MDPFDFRNPNHAPTMDADTRRLSGGAKLNLDGAEKDDAYMRKKTVPKGVVIPSRKVVKT